MTAIDPTSAAKLRAAIPEHQRHITDVGPTHQLLQAMIREARYAQRFVYLHKDSTRHFHMAEDTWPGRGPVIGPVLTALSWHSAGRLRAAGYKRDLFLGDGESEWWDATTIFDEWVPVLLAALDYQATHDSRVADWYLNSSCHTWFCPRHNVPKVPQCGAPTCREAKPGTSCTCNCRGRNHGAGPAPDVPALTCLDWESMPTPAWPSVPAEVRHENNSSHVARFELEEFGTSNSPKTHDKTDTTPGVTP